MNASDSLKFLRDVFKQKEIANPIFTDERFFIWSASSTPDKHHYGDNGLVIHTAEVVNLCLSNNILLNSKIDEYKLACAALYHDVGKIWDYSKIDGVWTSTDHKYKIHHI